MVSEPQTSLPLTRSPGAASAKPAARQRSSPSPRLFKDVLRDVRFSTHAQRRLLTRKIPLNGQDVGRIEHGMKIAGRKGIRESLVLLDDLALVVNVSNRTVITVFDGGAAKGSVFTNIDGAVIV